MRVLQATLATLIALSVNLAPAFADHHQSGESAKTKSADEVAIAAVIQDYFDGIGAADAEKLNRAFAADKAAMLGSVKNEDGTRSLMTFKDMEAVVAGWARNDNPEGAGRDGEILHMKIMEGQIAMVMFRYKDEYYDVLTLLKDDGVWKIVTKTFFTR
ncbi:MAG: nuclear transport factor 2 family protein [Pseudomonadota bacterium]